MMEGESLMEELANEAHSLDNYEASKGGNMFMPGSEDTPEFTFLEHSTSFPSQAEPIPNESHPSAVDNIGTKPQTTSLHKTEQEDPFRSPCAKKPRLNRHSTAKHEVLEVVPVEVSVEAATTASSSHVESESPFSPPSMADESTTLGGVPSLFGEEDDEDDGDEEEFRHLLGAGEEEEATPVKGPTESGTKASNSKKKRRDEPRTSVGGTMNEDKTVSLLGMEEEEDEEDETKKQLRKADEDRRLMALISHFTEDQWNRYESYKRTSFQRTAVRRMMQTAAKCTISQEVAIAMAGIAKVFVGEVVEEAVAFRNRIGEDGSLQPKHLHEALRILQHRGVSSRRRNCPPYHYSASL